VVSPASRKKTVSVLGARDRRIYHISASVFEVRVRELKSKSVEVNLISNTTVPVAA
jgi:hypothetical protein